jgi:hypothetical protein
MSTTSPRSHVLAWLLAAGLVLAACSSDDDTTSDGAPEPVAGTEQVADGQGSEEDVVEVILRDFEFVGLPDTIPAGTRLTIVNQADRELHELVAIRLPDEEGRPVEELAQLSPDELAPLLGPPATVLLAAPGGPVVPAVGDGTLSEPGRYAIVCAIPTGIDPQEYLDAAAATEAGPPQIDGAGPPHIVHGMIAEVLVR